MWVTALAWLVAVVGAASAWSYYRSACKVSDVECVSLPHRAGALCMPCLHLRTLSENTRNDLGRQYMELKRV